MDTDGDVNSKIGNIPSKHSGYWSQKDGSSTAIRQLAIDKTKKTIQQSRVLKPIHPLQLKKNPYALPSGELTFCNGKIHHFSWENPLFLWPFSIAEVPFPSQKSSAKSSKTSILKKTLWKKYGDLFPKSTFWEVTLWWTNKKQLKMAIEIVDFPMKNGGSFHCYV